MSGRLACGARSHLCSTRSGLGNLHTSGIDNSGIQIPSHAVEVSSKADGDGTVRFEYRRSEQMRGYLYLIRRQNDLSPLGSSDDCERDNNYRKNRAEFHTTSLISPLQEKH
jgi:hypothetical protein